MRCLVARPSEERQSFRSDITRPPLLGVRVRSETQWCAKVLMNGGARESSFVEGANVGFRGGKRRDDIWDFTG